MELLKAITLGVVQGLTEFLPVSSSGHLVIFSEILNFKEEGIAFEVFLHFGTLLSVLLAFRKDLLKMISAFVCLITRREMDEETREYGRWDLYIIIATLPAVVIGLAFKDAIEAYFSDVLLVYFMLIITAALMIFTQFLKERQTRFGFLNTLIIGVAQACAIMPGISRSGSTIFMGMAFGLNREKVARFSFLLSIPAVAGAVVLKTKDLLAQPPGADAMLNLITGTIVSFVVGYLAILWLMDTVKKGKLQWFGYYCLLLAGTGITWHFLG